MSKRVLIDLMGACVAGVCMLACSSSGDDTSGAAGALGTAGAAADEEGMDVECPDSYKSFAVGATGTQVTDAASGISMRVLEGDVPPSYGLNTWKIGLFDASGAPATNVHITWQCAYMSVHGHGTNPKSLTNLGNGQYEVTDQNFKMFGPWEIQFWLDPTGAMPDYTPTTNLLLSGKACEPTSGLMGKPSIQYNICVPRSGD